MKINLAQGSIYGILNGHGEQPHKRKNNMTENVQTTYRHPLGGKPQPVEIVGKPYLSKANTSLFEDRILIPCKFIGDGCYLHLDARNLDLGEAYNAPPVDNCGCGQFGNCPH